MIFLVTTREFTFPPPYKIVGVPEALTWLEQLRDISLDTETTGLDPHTEQLFCLQLGNQEHQYIIDAGTIDIRLFKPLLESRRLIGHNLKFDLKFLYRYAIYPRIIWDTFVVERVLYCGLPHVRGGLDHLTDRYLGYRLDKSGRENLHQEGFTHRVMQYAAEDILPLQRIMVLQQEALKAKDLMGAANLENRFTPALAYIEFCGFYLDRRLWKQKMEKDRQELNEAEQALNAWLLQSKWYPSFDPQLSLFEPVQCAVNWSSPQQVVEVFEAIGICCTVVEKGGLKKSVEAPVLEKQAAAFPIIPLYLRYKKAQKVTGTYGQSFLDQIHPVTGRLHTQFTQVMDTGRISSGKKDKSTGEDYINFQNIPSDPITRACFRAEEGNVLVISDYSGQEQIVLANKSLDKNLLKFYDEGLADMHSFVAQQMYPELEALSLDDIKTHHKDKRQEAKSGGFSINYGGTGKTIADNLGISLEEGNRIYDAYFAAFPGLKQYFKEVKQQGLRDGYILISTVTGRKSYLPYLERFRELEQQLTPEFWEQYREAKAKKNEQYEQLRPIVSDYMYYKGETERKSLNFPIQGSSAEITKISCVYIFKWILEKGLFGIVRFVNTIHDENVLECPAYLAEETALAVKDAMCRAGELFCKRVPLLAEPDISPYWRK